MTPISKEPTIRAFGLETRYWTIDPKSGYGCAECCNGDRCDEDCTAKYKGNRAGCPHCKGKGWIKPEDLDPVAPSLSKELSEQIEREAKHYSEIQYGDPAKMQGLREIAAFDNGVEDYTAGATAYAYFKEQFEQAKKALEEIVNTHQLYRDINDEKRESNHLRNIAYEALASWKEEGKEGE